MHCLLCDYRAPWIDQEEVPECPDCGEPLKMDAVLFEQGLIPQEIFKAAAFVRNCDVMILAGTAAQVYPVAYFPKIVLDNGGTVIEINLQPTMYSMRTHFLQGKFEEIMPQLVTVS